MDFNGVEIATGKKCWTEKTRQRGAVMPTGEHILFLNGKGNLTIVESSNVAFKPIFNSTSTRFHPIQRSFACTSPTVYKGGIYPRSLKDVTTYIDTEM